jgi:hypothetical protein
MVTHEILFQQCGMLVVKLSYLTRHSLDPPSSVLLYLSCPASLCKFLQQSVLLTIFLLLEDPYAILRSL